MFILFGRNRHILNLKTDIFDVQYIMSIFDLWITANMNRNSGNDKKENVKNVYWIEES